MHTFIASGWNDTLLTLLEYRDVTKPSPVLEDA